jgi:hypothetical protein
MLKVATLKWLFVPALPEIVPPPGSGYGGIRCRRISRVVSSASLFRFTALQCLLATNHGEELFLFSG